MLKSKDELSDKMAHLYLKIIMYRIRGDIVKNKKTLNILNGQCMYDYFINNNITYDGEIVPFNEAMCIGYYNKIPFSKEFIENRLKTHNVAFNQYKDLSLIHI